MQNKAKKFTIDTIEHNESNTAENYLWYRLSSFLQ